MFKYIESILSKFSVKQRLLALFLLLFFISLIYLTPKYLESFNPENKILESRLVNIQTRVNQLESEIEQKSLLLRSERLNCTNQIIERETQFIKMLSSLESGIKRIKKDEVNLERINLFSYDMLVIDSAGYYPSEPLVEDGSKIDDYALNEIKKYKSQLKKDDNKNE
jgi:hypothetical protein